MSENAQTVEFSYAAPDLSEEGDSVVWRWSVVNTGTAPVTKVVMTHRITPWVQVDRVTGPSEVVGEVVKSRWQTLTAGERVDGEIVATLPDDLQGSVRINGRIVWQNPDTA